MEDTHDLSEVFRHMAKSTKLLGLAIYEIQEVWKGPDELQQANYALRSLPKGLKFLLVVPPSDSPKVMGLVGIHDPDALHCFSGLAHCPWCGKESQNKGAVVNHLQTVHYSLVWWATNVTTTHQPHQRLSTAMASRNVHLRRGRPQWVSFVRVIASRRQAELICLNQESKQGSPGELASLGLPYQGHPPPIGTALEENWTEKVPPANLQCPVTCFPTHLDQAAACYSWITQDIPQQCWTL